MGERRTDQVKRRRHTPEQVIRKLRGSRYSRDRYCDRGVLRVLRVPNARVRG